MSYGWSAADEVHWRRIAKEMPRLQAEIRVHDSYSAAQTEMLDRAVLPGDMEDKWIVLPADDEIRVDFHRSWTGFAIFSVRFRERDEDPGCFDIAQVIVNRDPEQNGETDDAYLGELVKWLIRTLMLREEVPFPMKESSPDDDALDAAWSTGGAAAFPSPSGDASPETPPSPASPDDEDAGAAPHS